MERRRAMCRRIDGLLCSFDNVVFKWTNALLAASCCELVLNS